MTLGEFIKQYREEHKLSIRAFASLVGMSTQQISNIEKGIGNDGKPMTSTMKTYKKIAEAIGMTENDFLNMLSDNVTVNPTHPVSDDDIKFALFGGAVSDEAFEEVKRFAAFVAQREKEKGT